MLIDNTLQASMRLAIDRTRQSAISGPELARAHRNVGRLLAADIAAHLQIESCSIKHTTGHREDGVRLVNATNIAIVPLMRAGLFVAEGIWELLPDVALAPWFPGVMPMPSFPDEVTIVLVDAVINSGDSIQNAIHALREKGSPKIVVATLVGYMPTLDTMSEKYPDVLFVTGRASERTYTGSGATDTGARLFGTTGWERNI